jgi:glycosyltransferase involved in cell wall biosynthesis
MRILWVKAGKLLPLDTGGKIRSYNLLRQLRARHDVTLLSYYPGKRDAAYETEIRSAFPGAITAAISPAGDTPARNALHYAARLPLAAPYAVSKFTSSHVRRLVRDTLSESRCDVAVCDFLSASLNFPSGAAVPCVLFQHNVESLLWKRQARHEPNRLKRLLFQLEAAKMDRYERAAIARFDHVIAVSRYDHDAMASMIPAERMTIVPTGVDLAQYRAAGAKPAETPNVLFLGSMDWEANVDGAEYFCREIWPSVVARVPAARFQIVGRNPAPRVRRLASESIQVTGTVPSVLPYLAGAAVIAVPLRIGGGTRLKMFEGMAAGRATVSTSVGAEGLDVVGGRDLILADRPDAFADALVTLLSDPARRDALGAAGARLAAQYDWSAVIGRFEDALARACDRRAGSELAVAGAPA